MKTKKVYWGLMFILAAAFIVLHSAGVFDDIGVVSAVFAILLIPVIITSIIKHNFAGITFPLAIIAILFDEKLGIESFTPMPALFTALFLAIGLTLLFPRKHAWYNTKPISDRKVRGIGSEENIDGADIYINTRFGGTTRYIRSQCIKTVNIDASFGGAKIYFDGADIDGPEAIVNITSSFSGVDLYIPARWHVDNEITVSTGGVTEKGVQECEVTTKKITLRGNCGFSGVTIIRI